MSCLRHNSTNGAEQIELSDCEITLLLSHLLLASPCCMIKFHLSIRDTTLDPHNRQKCLVWLLFSNSTPDLSICDLAKYALLNDIFPTGKSHSHQLTNRQTESLYYKVRYVVWQAFSKTIVCLSKSRCLTKN